jgi:hypothetical protein
MTKPKIIVERVPLDYRPVDVVPNFPPMPVLYLELIENKDKVKPDLRDKTAQPIFLPEKSPELAPFNNNADFPRKEKTPEIYKPPVIPVAHSVSPESLIHSKLKERLKGSKKESREKSPIIQDRHSLRERRQEEERDREKYRSREAYRELEPERYSERRDEPRGDRRSHVEERKQYDTPPRHSPKKSDSKQTRQIRSLLGDTKSQSAAVPAPPVIQSLPPSLDQITAGEPIHVHGKVAKDVTYIAQEEAERRRDLLFRFDILRKSYKDASIPELSQFMDVETLDRMYQDTVRRVALDSKVDGYRRFLNMGFMGIELLFSNILKIDMTGFAKQQMASMNSYEKILIELGEKSLLDKTKSQWPAEVRLLFTIVMNAVIFVMTKAIMGGGLSKVMGSGGGGGGMGAIGGLMSGLMGAMGGGGMMGAPAAQSAPQSVSQNAAQASVEEQIPKNTGRKMRGPSTINLEELGSKKTN